MTNCERAAEWNRNHPERRAEIRKRYDEKNKEKKAAGQKAWRDKNKEKMNAYFYLRRAHKTTVALPKWVDKKELLSIYRKAKSCGLEVDHIIPLKHDLVCGLHVPENLQLLSREENARKSNRWEIA